MLAKAELRYLRQSPYKVRLVADLVRGKRVNEALSMLHFTRKRAAAHLEKLLRSAVAGLQTRENVEYDEDALYISRLLVDEGPTLKRFGPMSQGRAGMIRKRSCHIKIELAERKGGARKRRSKAKATAKA
jgi:large subunit ribosomal protein L22